MLAPKPGYFWDATTNSWRKAVVGEPGEYVWNNTTNAWEFGSIGAEYLYSHTTNSWVKGPGGQYVWNATTDEWDKVTSDGGSGPYYWSESANAWVVNSDPGGGETTENAIRILNRDAVRTWYNHPVVLGDGAYLYAGSVKSDGSVQVTQATDAAQTVATLSAALEVDDHDEATLLKLPSGKLACFYSKHSSDTTGLRYRVSTSALPDVSSFRAEETIANGGVSTGYTLPFLLSDDKVRVFYRNGSSTQRDRKMAKADVAGVDAGTPTWGLTTIFATTNQRPYMVACQNGTDRIDFLMTDGHPNELSSQLYHCYMQLVGGVEKYYKSDGTEITLPIDVTANATLVDSNTGGRVWNDKIAIGVDGHPRILFTKYPTGATPSGGVTYTDVEYWHGRWTGSAWVKTRLLTGQRSLYAVEGYYTGSMCFDGNDATILYLAEAVSNIYEIRKYSFDEGAATKTLVSSLTTNSAEHNFRPQSPAGASRPYAVNWLSGRYASYTSFYTRMNVAGTRATSTWRPTDIAADIWIDPSDLATMFVEKSSPSTPASVDGPVGTITDKGANGGSWSAPTDSARPTLRSAGGLYWLEFDQSDDCLLWSGGCAGLYAAGAASLFFGLAERAYTTNSYLYGEGRSSTTTIYGFNRSNTDALYPNASIRNDANAFTLNVTASPFLGLESRLPANRNALTFTDSGSVMTARVNGVAGSTPASYTRSGVLTLTNSCVGALSRVSIANYSALNLFSFFAKKSVVSGTDLANAETHCARKAGVLWI